MAALKRDTVFDQAGMPAGGFEFNAQVAEVFDDMLVRSIPFYAEQQRMLGELARAFWLPGTGIYDLGCSTATTLIHLCRVLPEGPPLVGYDNSKPMLARAQEKVSAEGLESRIELRYADLNGALAALEYENASVVTMCWTLQFIHPLRRDALLRRLYDGLVENGVLLVTEKVLTTSSDLNRLFIEQYYHLKRRNGYSENEITRKREALENVLIPYRIDEDIALFRRNGFEVVETFFQWYNFAGFLCVKRAVSSW